MPDIALIEYFTSEDKVFIFVVRPHDDKPIVYERELGEKTLKECRYKLLGKEKHSIPGDFDMVHYLKGPKPNLDYFHGLAKDLVDPFLKDVKDFDILYLIPHGWLHHLPLHALICEDGKYLIEKHKIVYSPSATVIKYCQAKNNARKSNDNNKNNIKRNCLTLAVGRENDSASIHKMLHEEAHLVAQDIFKGEGICKLEEDASKEFFIKNCKDKSVIHAACHGYFDNEQPLKSGLLLSNGSDNPIVSTNDNRTDVPEDMLLTAEEMFNLELNADLVTLSACVTGVNENKPGDELIGLTRALIYAGTPSVMVSLWPVHIHSTLELIKSFYKYWTDPQLKLSKVAALQKAQVDMIKNKPDWQDPFHWAPFILVGDWL
jgi:CHAT domain-containing protein